ncbi:MAG TPA: hypothetical protein VFY71_05990 [Planctomycetota bacterium]|nr:hypothetical protein [Planctomycetota bacterium]
MRQFACALAAAALVAAPAMAFDRVLLKDGRTIEGTLVPSNDAAVVHLKLNDIEVPIPVALVDKQFVENLADYKPKTKQEEENLKKGWVLFEGHWTSKDRRDGELAKRAAADKAAVEALRKRQNWKNAVTKDSTHFSVKSNADDAIVDEYIDRLEEFYKYFTDEWGVKIAPTSKNGKLAVELHRSIADLIHITGSGDTLTVTFNPGDGNINLYYFEENPEGTLRDLYELAFSQLNFFVNPKFWYPYFIREGLASYYATTQRGAGGKLSFGDLQYGSLLRLKHARDEGKLPTLMDLIDDESVKWTSVHEAACWSLAHFLMETPKYGKSFRAFVGNLPNNKDAGIHQEVAWFKKGATIDLTEPKACAHALEKRLGVDLAELEKEWKASLDADVPMTGEAYYLAGDAALDAATAEDSKGKEPSEEEAAKHVREGLDNFEAAAKAGDYRSAYFYRRYAELLRKGGIVEDEDSIVVQPPDGVRAWEMVRKALEVAPVDPYNYAEAAGVLVMDGPQQNLDLATSYAKAAVAIAGPRNLSVKSLADEVLAIIEPAREAARQSLEAAKEADEHDQRKWHVAFYFVEGTEPPANLTDLSTAELRDLVRSGKVGAEDSVFQAWRESDEQTGELLPGKEAWDMGWVKLKDCPVFADDLAAAPAAAPASAPPAGGAGAPGG